MLLTIEIISIVSGYNKSFRPKKLLIKSEKKKRESRTFSSCSNHHQNLGFSDNLLVVFQSFRPRNFVTASPKTDQPHFGHPKQS